MTDNSTRLNKYLALQLGISRREADVLIDSSTVEINGRPAALGARVKPGDNVTVASASISKKPQKLIYLALNKPVGYVCSRKPQGNSPTIYTLLPAEYHRLKPVGRLDRNSSGLLLLTNDGDFAYRMTHPKFTKTKIYHVQLDNDLAPLHQQMISDFGVQLEDGRSQLTLARLSDERRDKWQVTMSEGRNRQIRRTFSALGYEVKRLHRVQFGNYTLNNMKRGDYLVIDRR